jgi:hypothetical protein
VNPKGEGCAVWAELVTVIASLIAAMGIVAAIVPKLFLDQLVVLDLPSRLWALVAIRVAIGVAIWSVAPEAGHPTVFRAFGGITIAAGLALPVVGRERIARALDWWLARPTAFLRAWGAVAAAFALFLLWSLHAA